VEYNCCVTLCDLVRKISCELRKCYSAVMWMVVAACELNSTSSCTSHANTYCFPVAPKQLNLYLYYFHIVTIVAIFPLDSRLFRLFSGSLIL